MNKILNYSLIISAAFAVSLSSCDSDTSGHNDFPDKWQMEPNESYAKDMAVSSNSNAFKLLAMANKEDANKNSAISPLSLNEVLGMMSNGARGNTQSEIWTALGYSGANQNFVNESFYSINSLLPNLDPDRTNLYISNSIWIDEDFSVKDDFISDNEKYFMAEVRKQKLATTQTMSDINQWCNEKTNGAIPQIMSDPLDADVDLIGLNALYFKGAWSSTYYEKCTEKRDFHCADGTLSPIDMFEGKCGYVRDNKVIIAELPYGNQNLCMNVIIPNKELKKDTIQVTEGDYTYSKIGFYHENVTDIDYIINEYLDINGFDSLCSCQFEECTDFVMPIFKLEADNDFIPTLQEMGMKSAFCDSANFTGMTDDPMKIKKVFQKVIIDVNEKGTVAAAGSGYRGHTLGMDVSKFTLNFDQPFVYVIRDKKYNTILFVGKVAKL